MPTRILITSDDPRLGSGGAAFPVDLRDLHDGTAMMVLSDGRELGPIPVLAGPAGPAVSLQVGTVATGANPALTIRGESPHLILDAVLPAGKSAYEYAVANGYKGTEAEYAAAATPASTDWSQVVNKPATFPASSHTHPVADVAGLQAALDGKVAGTDSRLSDARTPTAHKHPWTDVTGAPTTFPAAAHSHAIADVTGLQAKLDTIPTSTAWAAAGFTLAAGWEVYPSPVNWWQPFVWRVANGRVQLNGLLKRTGAAVAAGSTVGTLPSGSRPSRSWPTGNLRIDADGRVLMNDAVAQNDVVAVYGEAPIG